MQEKQDPKYRWNLSILGINEKEFIPEKDLLSVVKVYKEFSKKWSNNKSYLTDPTILLQALDEYADLDLKCGIAGNAEYYFELRSAQDQENPDIKAINNKIQDISVSIANEIRFFLLDLSKIALSNQKVFLTDKSLEKYHHFLECLFLEASHLLSDPEEKILTITSQTSYGNWVQMTSDLISREERDVLNAEGVPIKASISEIIKLTSDKNKIVRDKAAFEFNSILDKYSDIAEAEMNSILQSKKNTDELRSYARPEEARILSDDLSLDVVDTLISTVTERFSISKTYYEFKSKLFGLQKLAYHERNLDYGDISNKKYSFEKSVTLVKDVFASLDIEFLQIFEEYLDQGKIDVFPYKGKTPGAFCTSRAKHQPGFVLLNHMDQLNDITTIAHEMGHAINNELIRKRQPPLYFDTPLSTAEVASTFMEDFVLKKLEDSSDEELKLALLLKTLDDDVSTIMRQVACFKFEQDLHKEFRKKGYLPKKLIGDLFIQNMRNYMGDFVSYDEGSENWWVYWSHIRSFFYVYSYASGLLISKSLQKMYTQDKTFMLKIKEFLSAGTSDSPQNIFMNLGVDIKDNKFWKMGLIEVEETLKKAQLLAMKLGKIN